MTVLPWSLVVVIYTVESKVETAIRAVGKVGKRSGEDAEGKDDVEKTGGLDESIRVTVTVDCGTGEDVSGEIIRLVTVDGGLLKRLEGDGEKVSGDWEGLVSGKDELGSMVGELGVNDVGEVEGREGVEEGTGVEDVREGLETIVVVGKGVDVIVKLVKEGNGEEGSELESVIEGGEVIEDRSKDDMFDGETEELGLD